ncbi:beta-ketoacyl-ACP synthase 3 [Synoicihabitans lomoniglobus]|uniref:Beta-ketoacyl-ACP synthase 3 n=1 Tax=Synoicihabitans lomoniglobus TaxID=2909285 RepID=A0AAE9ZUY6_9BACT|nr:beta-ketoacyl-ACP synthase 3 [Opitutaceae bacterium LMO-M01]WED63564.1 beta-ketoacyl-ACP synthase 3 [Opitutaceae bacterium LMO-M01]
MADTKPEPFLIDVPIPSMGATVNELTIIDVMVNTGDTFAKGDKIAELESDKSVFEFEAPCDGTLQALEVRAGDIVPSGSPFMRIATVDDSLLHLAVKGDAAVVAPQTPSAAPKAASPAATPVPSAAPVPTGPQWTPRAAKLAKEAGLDPVAITDIKATGPGGRVSGDDVAAYLASRATAPVAASAPAALPETDGSAATVCIAGVGYAVPTNVRSTKDVLKEFPGRTEEEMVKLTGIRERRFAGEGETATDLAVIAVGHALEQSGVDIASIDGVIMATIIPDQPVPAMASALAQKLGVPGALAFDLNAACSGWLYALEIGRSLILGGTARNLIVVTAELLSRITNPRDHETAFLFGDGAGAAILTNAADGHRLHRMALSGDANKFSAIQRRGGGANKPWPKPEAIDVDDFYLQVDGPVVFKGAVIAFANEIEDTLRRHNLKPEDIGWIVPHQANERILRAVSKRVGIPFDRFVVTIDKYGNTSGASVSMALGWAAEEEIFQSGDKIIFCSVGAGFTFAGGLLVW